MQDMTVQPDQGPFHEAGGNQTPESSVNQAQEQATRPAYPDADQDTGEDEQPRVAEPTSGDPQTPGEVEGEGNAEGLTQGINAG
ncbi:hypothetical protein ADJ73_04425 [Arsenicicoccus sp. oral taxon 190]|nr:hypothetical protein ADJ73_04425 [Arsenicicoccus sp. oral taxon 190]